MTELTEQWTILGAGAIGHLLACRFAQRQIPATLVTRQQTVKTVSNTGYQFKGKTEHYPLTYSSVADCKKVTKLLLTVKSHQVEDAIVSIKDAIAPDCRIFLMQNGMGTLEKVSALLADRIPPENIYPGTNTHGAYLERSGEGTLQIIHAGEGAIVFGHNYLANPPTDQPPCFEQLKALSLNTNWVDDIERRLWLKLAVNAAINPLTALNDCLNGELLESPALKTQLLLLCEETASLFSQMKIDIQEHELISEVFDVIQLTAANQSSMLQDVKSGKITEIDAITGYLLKKSKKYTIDMPCHQDLYQQIKKS